MNSTYIDYANNFYECIEAVEECKDIQRFNIEISHLLHEVARFSCMAMLESCDPELHVDALYNKLPSTLSSFSWYNPLGECCRDLAVFDSQYPEIDMPVFDFVKLDKIKEVLYDFLGYVNDPDAQPNLDDRVNRLLTDLGYSDQLSVEQVMSIIPTAACDFDSAELRSIVAVACGQLLK